MYTVPVELRLIRTKYHSVSLEQQQTRRRSLAKIEPRSR
jgi:hypothetical protein